MISYISPYFYVKVLQNNTEITTNKIIRYNLKAQAKIFTTFTHQFQLFSGHQLNLETLKQNSQVKQLYSHYLIKNILKFKELFQSLEKQSVLKSNTSKELNEIYHLERTVFMSFLLTCNNTLQELTFFPQKQQKSMSAKINRKSVFQQIQKTQYLTVDQKIKRFQLVSKSKYHGKFQIRNNEVFVKECQNLGDRDKLISVKKLLQNSQKFIISKTDKNTLSKKFTLFLLNYYKEFKKDVGFYPPKLSLKYIMFNTVSKDFQVSSQYLILWCLGLIQQPLTFLQKINYIEKNNRGGQFYMDQNQIYIDATLKNTFQNEINEIRNNNIKHNYFLTKLQKIIALVKLQKSKFYKEKYTKNNQRTFEEFFEFKHRKKEAQNKWQGLDQFVGVYNYIMTIYHFSHGYAYKFFDKNSGKKIVSQSNIQQSQKKQFLARHCLQSKKKLWEIFYESIFDQKQKKTIIFEMEKQISISFQQINLILAQNPQKIIKNVQSYENQFKADIIKRKLRNSLILNFLSFTVDSSSSLLIAIHNPIRYTLVYLLCQLNKQISAFETEQYEKCFKYGQYVVRRKTIEANKFLKKHQQKFQTYKEKTYKKLQEYACGDNYELKNMMNTKLKIYMQKIEEWRSKNNQIQNQKQNLQAKQIIQIIDLILKLANQFIMTKKLVHIKNLQLKHQYKKTQNSQSLEEYPLEQDMFSFCCNTMQFNNYLLLVLTTILKDLPTQNLLLQNSNIKSLQEIDVKHQKLIKKVTQNGTFKIQSILNIQKRIQQWNKVKLIEFQLKQHVAQVYGRKMIEMNLKKQYSILMKKQNKSKNDKSYVQKVGDYCNGFLELQKLLIEKLTQSEILSLNNQKLTLIGLQCSQKLGQQINLYLIDENISCNYPQISSHWLQILKMMNQSRIFQKKLNKEELELFLIIKGILKNQKIQENGSWS